MSQFISHLDAKTYLQTCITNNKARGLVAEFAVATLKTSGVAKKIIDGAWLLSPNCDDYYKYRHAVFVLPTLFRDATELSAAVTLLQADRAFQALATFLTQSCIAVVVSGAVATPTTHPHQYAWSNYCYLRELLELAVDTLPFRDWPGNRGRSSPGATWEPDVSARFDLLTEPQITAITLRQAFYYGYLKQAPLKKPLADPYDVDAFIVGVRGTVMPVEIKEKSATSHGDFGLDAGRILMMLRMCLPTDSNGIYLIREVDNSPERNFLCWRYVTLADMILGCSWNLQGGGASMSGGATQTVMLHGGLFREFNSDLLSEDWLATNGSLQRAVGSRASQFATELAQFVRVS